MDAKKIFIGCGAAHPELCTRVTKDYDRYKYWFRLTPINSKYLGQVDFILLGTAAAIMQKTLGIKKIKVGGGGRKGGLGRSHRACRPKDASGQRWAMEVVGVWRPSPVAKDCTAELAAIQRSGAHIVFTTFSSSVGLTFCQADGRTEGARRGGGHQRGVPEVRLLGGHRRQGANYTETINTYARVAITPKTIPFYDKYVKALQAGAQLHRRHL